MAVGRDGGSVHEPRDLARFVDHTLLAPGIQPASIQRLCAEAREHGFAAVCVRREWAPLARTLLAGTGVRLAVVVDFHEGASTTAARIEEASAAVHDGAEELDLVAPLPDLRAGRFAQVFEDLRAVISAASPVPVKVILETVVLTRDQKVAGAAVALAAGAAFVKTSTGFGGGGATVEDVALLRSVVGARAGVKASGGVRTTADALALLRAGADRIGTSNGVAIVTGKLPAGGSY
jgi:deoxyribose-phosphate aldolase